MNWLARRKTPIDLPGIFSAPWLLFFTCCLVIVIAWKDYQLRTSQPKPVVIHIEPTVEDEDILNEIEHIPAHLSIFIETLLKTGKELSNEPQQFHAEPVLHNSSEDERLQFYAYLGKRLTKLGRFDEAITVLENLTSDERIKLNSTFAYAFSLSKVGRKELAINSYKDELATYPTRQATAVNLGLLQLHTGHYEDAIQSLDYAADISSGDRKGKALAAKGRALEKLARYGEAVTTYHNSINYRPSHSATWLQLAEARRKNQDDSALVTSAYTKANALEQNNYAPSFRMANYLFSVGRFREAIPHYRNSHRLAKDRYNLLFYRAANLYVSVRPGGAKRVVKLLARLNLSRSQKEQVKLLSALLSRNTPEIKKYLKRLVSSKKNDESLFLQLLANIELDNLEKVQEQLSNIDHRSVFYLPIHYLYVRKLYNAQAYDAAKSVLEKIMILGENSPQVHYEFARILEKSSRPKQALEYVKKAHLLEPNSKKISLELSEQLLAANQVTEAIAILIDLVQQYPTYSKGAQQLATLLMKDNQFEQAASILETALEGDEENITLLKQLIEIHYKKHDYKQSLILIDQLLLLDSSRIDVRVYRANCLINLQQLEKAKREIEMIRALRPENKVLLELEQNLQMNAQ